MTVSFTHRERGVGDLLHELDAAGFEVDEPVRIRRIVLDTFDGRLHRAGLRLEQLTGDERALELRGAPGSPPARVGWARSAPVVVADLPAGPFGARVAPVVAERALLEILALGADERVARRRDRRDKAVVSVVVSDDLDAGCDAEVPSWVATVVPTAGHDDDAARLVSRLEEHGFERHDGDVVEMVAATSGRSLEGRTSSPTVPLDPGEDALVAVRAVLANLAHTMVDNMPGTLADLDPEFLHELRVAVRRTRSVLAESKGIVPTDVRARFRAEFKELGAVTSRTRDLDVYVLGWSDLVAPLHLDDPATTAPVLEALEAHRRRAHAEMAAVLDSPATRALLDEWRAWLADPGEVEPAGPIGPAIAERTARAQEVLLDAGRAITPASPAEALHDLRKDAKVLRYLLECFGGLHPAKVRKAFVAQLKALQDNLGEHQDTEVQLDELRSVAHDLHASDAADTDALLAVGRIIDHLERRRQAARDEFTERFAAYDTKDNRRLLGGMLAGAARAGTGARR